MDINFLELPLQMQKYYIDLQIGRFNGNLKVIRCIKKEKSDMNIYIIYFYVNNNKKNLLGVIRCSDNDLENIRMDFITVNDVEIFREYLDGREN